MPKKRSSKTSSKSKGGTLSKAVKAGSSLLSGGSKSGGKRRSRGPNYWANKVITEKLKQKYRRLKYGTVR